MTQTHAYWSVLFTSGGSGNEIDVNELQMFSAYNSDTSACTGGTAIDGEHFSGSYLPANAFDGNLNTGQWASTGAAFSSTKWVGYHFASPIAIVSMRLMSAAPWYAYSYDVRYSDDGVAWTVIASFSPGASGLQYGGLGRNSGTGETRFIVQPGSGGAGHRYWRINATAINTGTELDIADLTFSTSGTALHSAVSTPVFSSGFIYGEYYAADKITGDGKYWAINTTPPYFYAYDFGTNVSPDQVCITIAGHPESPTALTVDYSDNGSSWTTLLSLSPGTWSDNQKQCFSLIVTRNYAVTSSFVLGLIDSNTNSRSRNATTSAAVHVTMSSSGARRSINTSSFVLALSANPAISKAHVQTNGTLRIGFDNIVIAKRAPAGLYPTPQFDYWPTVISQYANSPIILSLIESFRDCIDPSVKIDDFFVKVWNIQTAQGYGLDVWGRIVNVSRLIKIPGGKFLGFNDTQGYEPFNSAPMYHGSLGTTNYLMADDYYRKIILIKAFSNISRCTVATYNRILNTLFEGRGKCFCTDTGHMSMRFVFEFHLEPFEIALLKTSNILFTPAGVGYHLMEVRPPKVFGFSKSNYARSGYRIQGFNKAGAPGGGPLFKGYL